MVVSGDSVIPCKGVGAGANPLALDRLGATGAEHRKSADARRWLFPTVHMTGAIGTGAMSGDAVAAMIQRRAAAAGFTPAQVDLLGGHSLRSGFVTEAFRAGADGHSIMRQTGIGIRRCSRSTPTNTPPSSAMQSPASVSEVSFAVDSGFLGCPFGVL
jgi:hypothetical protein